MCFLEEEVFFPWIKILKKKFRKTFPDCYNDEAISLFYENVEKEFQTISVSEEQKRAEVLCSMLSNFYLHFCWKIRLQEGFSNAPELSMKLLYYIIVIGVILSDGDPSSQWIVHILTAIKLFTGGNSLLYNALLQADSLRKKYHAVYSVILKHVLCKERLECSADPEEFMKAILLLRRFKVLTKCKKKKMAIAYIASKIPLPSNIISWLSSLNIEGLKEIKYNIAAELLDDKISMDCLKQLRAVLLGKKKTFKRKLEKENLQKSNIDKDTEYYEDFLFNDSFVEYPSKSASAKIKGGNKYFKNGKKKIAGNFNFQTNSTTIPNKLVELEKVLDMHEENFKQTHSPIFKEWRTPKSHTEGAETKNNNFKKFKKAKHSTPFKEKCMERESDIPLHKPLNESMQNSYSYADKNGIIFPEVNFLFQQKRHSQELKEVKIPFSNVASDDILGFPQKQEFANDFKEESVSDIAVCCANEENSCVQETKLSKTKRKCADFMHLQKQNVIEMQSCETTASDIVSVSSKRPKTKHKKHIHKRDSYHSQKQPIVIYNILHLNGTNESNKISETTNFSIQNSIEFLKKQEYHCTDERNIINVTNRLLNDIANRSESASSSGGVSVFNEAIKPSCSLQSDRNCSGPHETKHMMEDRCVDTFDLNSNEVIDEESEKKILYSNSDAIQHSCFPMDLSYCSNLSNKLSHDSLVCNNRENVTVLSTIADSEKEKNFSIKSNQVVRSKNGVNLNQNQQMFDFFPELESEGLFSEYTMAEKELCPKSCTQLEVVNHPEMCTINYSCANANETVKKVHKKIRLSDTAINSSKSGSFSDSAVYEKSSQKRHYSHSFIPSLKTCTSKEKFTDEFLNKNTAIPLENEMTTKYYESIPFLKTFCASRDDDNAKKKCIEMPELFAEVENRQNNANFSFSDTKSDPSGQLCEFVKAPQPIIQKNSLPEQAFNSSVLDYSFNDNMCKNSNDVNSLKNCIHCITSVTCEDAERHDEANPIIKTDSTIYQTNFNSSKFSELENDTNVSSVAKTQGKDIFPHKYKNINKKSEKLFQLKPYVPRAKSNGYYTDESEFHTPATSDCESYVSPSISSLDNGILPKNFQCNENILKPNFPKVKKVSKLSRKSLCHMSKRCKKNSASGYDIILLSDTPEVTDYANASEHPDHTKFCATDDFKTNYDFSFCDATEEKEFLHSSVNQIHKSSEKSSPTSGYNLRSRRKMEKPKKLQV